MPHPIESSTRRLTEGRANDQLLYFTSPSLTADDRTLVFISDRDSPVPKHTDPRAAVNLYALDRPTGRVRRLTDNDEGYLRSYVYFEGLRERGLGLASPCLHAPSGDLYYLQGRELRCVNAHTGATRALAELPPGLVTGFTHVSDDNTRVCVPTIDAAAFADIGAIDLTVQRLGLTSHLRVFDARSGAEVSAIPVARGWVTHVQFQPGSHERILYNHEWPADCGVRRVWLWDGERHLRLRDEGPGRGGAVRRREDWVCHEVWTRDGAWVIYHGTYGGHDEGPSFVGRVRPDGSGRAEVVFDPRFRRYGHFTLAADHDLLVSDGYYEPAGVAGPAGDPSLTGDDGGEWISLLRVDWEAGALAWRPLCRHGSSWSSQDAHPHPVFSHAGGEVLFTSDVEGKRAVYAVAL
ncbi:MAG TPA: oligogalacturonate lyase family protein [Roseiflexaceae bacterium]|nr:oligogalacturonate lyase family protein [Roseiflexaceae bacterium]